MLIPVLDSCHWQPNADSKPEAVAYGRTGTSFKLGLGTMEPADTCIGRALRGRQSPHAPLPV
jgi:hypothetical protein